MSTMTQQLTPCVESADVFQHPLLEDYPTQLTAGERTQQAALQSRAEAACLACPLFEKCLTMAVLEHDVAGYVAASTPRQRTQMRNLLGVSVKPDNFDTLTGASTPNTKVDHEEVLRVRKAHPDESLEALAERLGCSLSTVKRHLRRARREDSASTPRLAVVRPSSEQVMQAWTTVTSTGRGKQRSPRAA